MSARPMLTITEVSKRLALLPAADAAITAVTDQPFIVNPKLPILSILSCRILYSSVILALKSASLKACPGNVERGARDPWLLSGSGGDALMVKGLSLIPISLFGVFVGHNARLCRGSCFCRHFWRHGLLHDPRLARGRRCIYISVIWQRIEYKRVGCLLCSHQIR